MLGKARENDGGTMTALPFFIGSSGVHSNNSYLVNLMTMVDRREDVVKM